MSQGIRSIDALEQLVADYEKFDEFCIDVETMGDHRLSPQRNEVFWISLAGPGRADAIPCGHPIGERIFYEPNDETHRINKQGKYQEHRINEESGRLKWFDLPPQFTPAPKQLWRSDVIDALRPLLFSDRRKIGHRVKFDIESLTKYYYGETPPGPYVDTLVAARLVNENYPSYRLGDCVHRAFHYRYDKIGKNVEEHPYSEALRYSYLDAKWDYLLWKYLEPRLKREKVDHIFDLEMNLVPLIIDMELTGMSIDEKVLNELGAQFSREMATLQIAISARAGKPINLNAPKQKAELVYDILGKTCKEYTPSGQRSTAKETLEAFKKNRTVAQMLDYAALQKLQSSFINSLHEKVFEGKVHPEFNQVGARTGRASCSEPNLQQIPSRSDRGKRIREVFVASPGNVLIVSDLSQIELRVLAHYCRDKRLLDAYRQGISLHVLTAELIFGKEYTPRQYSLAKNGNFAAVYGAGAPTLVRRYEFQNVRVAKQFIDAFYRTYRRVEPWKQEVWNETRQRYRKGKTPYVETILGRRRRLPGMMSNDFSLRSGAERQAISTIIQGSAADLFKVIMLNTDSALQMQQWEGHVLMTVHDEIIVEVPEKRADAGLALVKHSMENVPNPFTGEPILSVPLVAEAKIVERWSEAKE